MLKIGLTGGIGAGKSTVADCFRRLGVEIIDADVAARRVVAVGQPALRQIRQLFGEQMLTADGVLNRSALRDIVFADADARRKLEALLHPLIYADMQADIDRLVRLSAVRYCIVCIPLLLETGRTDFVDRILVVDCPVEQQIARVQKRDRLSPESILRIVESQAPRALRLARADDVLDNADDSGELAERVKKLHNLYLSISEARN